MPAMPVTTVQKIKSVMIIVTMRMKASPSGLMATACVGLRYPNRTAIAMPTVTCTQSDS